MVEVNPATVEMCREELFPIKGAISVAVVTGAHPYDVPPFNRLFQSMNGIDAYIQDLETFCMDVGKVRTRYDVVLLYNWHGGTPQDHERLWYQKGLTQILEEFGQTEQGVVIMYHAIMAFQYWPFWSEMVGIPHEERGFTEEEIPRCVSLNETIHIDIVDSEHPITKCIKPFDFIGRTWSLHAANLQPDCHVLMTTNHPKMTMKAMAWTHQFRKARVFNLQPGSDNNAWSHPTFRTVLLRGIQWAAGRI
jgi:uncharacterized protein